MERKKRKNDKERSGQKGRPQCQSALFQPQSTVSAEKEIKIKS